MRLAVHIESSAGFSQAAKFRAWTSRLWRADGMPRRSLRSETEDLLRETRQLKRRLEIFQRSAREIMPPLRKRVSSAENEVMVSPRANVLGTLEHLLNQDVPDVLRQLEELTTHLRTDPEMKVSDARLSQET